MQLVTSLRDYRKVRPRHRLQQPGSFPDLLRDVPNRLIAKQVGVRATGTVGAWKAGKRKPQQHNHDALRDLELVVLTAMGA